MRRYGVMVLILWLLLIQTVAAAGSVKIDDPDNLLGGRRADVERAAQQLAAKGTDVAVIVVKDDNGDPNNATAGLPYVNARIKQLGVGQSTTNLSGNTVVFFRAAQSGHTGVYYVPGLKAKLDPAMNTIFTTKMRPLFTSNDVAGGMVAGIEAVNATVYPPTSPFVYLIGGVVVLGALVALIGPQISKRRAAAATIGAARDQAAAARSAAGAAIADLGQLMRTAQEKAQYDRLSYTPADLSKITDFQTRGEQVFVEAQALFDQAEADQATADGKPTVDAYAAVADTYARSQSLTAQAAQSIKEAERLRATLDQTSAQPGPATGPTQRL